jgi:Xaa-Pro aminopeptidase
MKYTPLPPSLYIKNRSRLAALLENNCMAVFHSNDIMPTNADGTMGFRQNSDLQYLTGIDQEESILLIFPDTQWKGHKEVLFVRETNEHLATWEGHKFTLSEAREISGIEKVYYTQQFDSVFNTLMCEANGLYVNTNEHTRAKVEVETRDARNIRMYKEKYPAHRLHRAAPLMHQLRAIKMPEELEALKQACAITRKGFLRSLAFIKPGVMEYEIEAELIHEFIRNRSNGFAYGPIIASGKNACVLHYTQNNQPCKDGEVILMDVAAEYANYASDLTRAVPVNGRFTPRQKAVYNAVLHVMKQAIQMLVVGNTWDDYHAEVGKIMENELLSLGLISKEDIEKQNPDWPAYKKYFMHGTSHFLGLDVHDVGSKYRKFEDGMVFTCEPGIYIPQENLGIRLENNILITSKGPIDLMADIPLEADEIESLMQERK